MKCLSYSQVTLFPNFKPHLFKNRPYNINKTLVNITIAISKEIRTKTSAFYKVCEQKRKLRYYSAFFIEKNKPFSKHPNSDSYSVTENIRP